MSQLLKIMLLVVPLLMLTSCFERLNRRDDEREIARVGDAVLYEKDVRDIYPPQVSETDSLRLLETYTESWVRRQIKLQEAERMLSSEGVDIEDKIEDYRTSLLNRSLDDYYASRLLDTVVTDEQIKGYYRQYMLDFTLDRNIVKGRIVRVPNTFRQQVQLKGLMGSPDADSQQDFTDMCLKNNFELTAYNNWVDFRQLLSKAPVVSGYSYENMLSLRSVQELSDAENKYYIQITACLKKGEPAPLE